MKNLLFFLAFIIVGNSATSQTKVVKKPATIGLHFFYNDFASAQQLKTNGFGPVVKNNNWTAPNKLQGGFGLDYMQGLTSKIDAVGTLNASWVDYLLQPSNTLYGSNNFLLDVSAGTHFKIFSEKSAVNPFLITKVGYSTYQNLSGFSLQPGAGVQVNFFDEALALITVEYRKALGNSISSQMYYSLGIATNIKTHKAKQELVKPEPPKPEVVEPTKALAEKNITVTLTDEATRLPLQGATITVVNENGQKSTGVTDASGVVSIAKLQEGSYTLNGMLNNIATTSKQISKADFATNQNEIKVALTHNDPRFTLVGSTINLTNAAPLSNTDVIITNITSGQISRTVSDATSGSFQMQIDPNSHYTIVGKKANYISNIEHASTKGLLRSTTLYVNIKLGIEEVKQGATIRLNNIYFETGKSVVDASASTDLKKLVQFLNDNPTTRLEIQGHSDNVGSLASNVKLSQQRANSVVSYLTSNGIDKGRLVAKGYGPAVPIADNNTSEGRGKNRRVEMKLLD